MQLKEKGQNVAPFSADGAGRSVPWQMFAFVLGLSAFLFVLAGLFVLGCLYYIYGEEWTWTDLGRPGFGKIQEQVVLQ